MDESMQRLSPQESLSNLGLDSLMLMDLKSEIQRDLGIELSVEELVEGRTLEDLTALLSSKLAVQELEVTQGGQEEDGDVEVVTL